MFDKYLLSVYLPCFNYWNMKHLWILNDSWAAAWVQEVPCLKKTSLADSGQRKFCSLNLEGFCFYFTLAFRNGSYFIPLVFKMYFAEFNYTVHSLPSSPCWSNKIKILETFSKRIIFTMYSLSKYSQTRPHQTM